ncbi:serine hydrolase domain-containing protein [Myroides sp. LJL119]
MKYTPSFPIILLSVFMLLSCESNQTKQQNLLASVDQPEHDFLEKTLPPYSVDFEKLDPSYILQKNQEVEEFYLNNIKKNGYTGSFLVAKNGQVIYEDYSGFSDKKNAKQIDKDTPIHVASVGKVVTAISILRLVDQNKLDLDQSVQDIIPGFGNPEITVRSLLNHRSGLTYYGYYQDIWDNQTPITNQDVIDVIKNKRVDLAFTPNTQFSYSNTNYVVLASIVEKITGKNFDQALRELIFDPLQMHNSFVLQDLDQKHTVTQSYMSNYRPMHWDYMDGTYGDKNIFLTPRDFLKLDTALYSDEFLSPELKQQMFKGYSYERKGKRNYGLGFRLIELDNNQIYTYHNGWWRGNTSSYIRLAKDNVCIILFSNKYSTATYKTISLSHHFGDYPVGNMKL